MHNRMCVFMHVHVHVHLHFEGGEELCSCCIQGRDEEWVVEKIVEHNGYSTMLGTDI